MSELQAHVMAIDAADSTGTFIPLITRPGTKRIDGTEIGQAQTRVKVGAGDVNVASAWGTHSSDGSSKITSVVRNGRRARLSHIVFTGPAAPAVGIITFRPFAQTASSPKKIVEFNQTASPGTTGTAYGREIELGFHLDGGFIVDVATAGQSFYIVYEIEQIEA